MTAVLRSAEIRQVEETDIETRRAVLRAFLGEGMTNMEMERRIFGITGRRGFRPWAVYQYYGLDGSDQGRFRNAPRGELDAFIEGLLGSAVIRAIHQLRGDISTGELTTLEDLAVRLKQLEAGETTGKFSRQQVRVGQSALRAILLHLYTSRCALCETALESQLVTSHIDRWADNTVARLNPGNAILLCRQHDGLFEEGLISLGDSYELLVSPELDLDRSPALIAAVRNVTFRRPLRFPPAAQFLERHRQRHGFERRGG